MAKLTEEAKKIIAGGGLATISTASRNGKSRVRVKGTFHVVDDSRLAFINLDSSRTMANLRDYPRLSAVVFDADSGRSCRIEGKTDVIVKGEVFDSVVAEVGKLKVPYLVLLKILEVEVY
ncbi:MAG: pyridoxamine 5'-phosphate oxidase family protein [Dehalococcoidia bacterium]|jgi:pyridoxine/pyridoxamine 5'-phosphate oxidase